MITSTLIDKIDHLPAVLSKDLEDYLVLLQTQNDNKILSYPTKRQQNKKDDVNLYRPGYVQENKKPKLKREFGSLKGFVTYMADDFDAPLDDFKEYQ